MKSELTIFLENKSGQAPEWILLLPLGEVALGDGRERFLVDEAALKAMVQHFGERGVDLVIDYEHQTPSGHKAPAAGWIKELEARAEGLWARVEWTEEARRHLEAKEYRYFSPVLRLEKENRRPVALLHVALTNTPAINHLSPLVAKSRSQWPAVSGQKSGPQAFLEIWQPAATHLHEEKNLEELLERMKSAMGLNAETSGEEVLALAVEKLNTIPVFMEAANLLGLPDEASAAQIKGAVSALQSNMEQLRQVQEEFAALKAELAEQEVQEAVQGALKAGKIYPYQKETALRYARNDMEGFKTFIEKALPVVPLGELNVIRDDTGPGGGGLTSGKLAVCEAMGLAPEAFKAQERRLRAENLL